MPDVNVDDLVSLSGVLSDTRGLYLGERDGVSRTWMEGASGAARDLLHVHIVGLGREVQVPARVAREVRVDAPRVGFIKSEKLHARGRLRGGRVVARREVEVGLR